MLVHYWHCVKHEIEWIEMEWIGLDWIGFEWNGMELIEMEWNGMEHTFFLQGLVCNLPKV